MRETLRVGAYAVCVRDGQVLLARWIGDDERLWTLPGGGVEHGEDPYDAVLREVAEETGYAVEPTVLLGVHTRRSVQPRRRLRLLPGRHDHVALRIVYEARVTGGTTDLAAWYPLDEVEGLTRTSLVDVGLHLWRARPAHGHATAPEPA